MSEFICSNCREEYDEVPEDCVCHVCGCDAVVDANWFWEALGEED